MKREYNEEYVERAIDMCKKLAWKFARGNYDLFEEYLSEAYIGATKALNTYDENSGIQFSTYCGTCARNEILMFIRSTKDKQLKLLYENDDYSMNLILSDVNIEDEIIYKDLYNKTMDYIENNFKEKKRDIIFYRMKHPKYSCRKIGEHFGCSHAYINRILLQSEEKVRYFIYKK
jgi:RNA polymerase sigma factor (sigma-70 family)